MSQPMMSLEEIRRLVRGFLNDHLQEEVDSDLTDETPLITGGILDSIGSVRMVSFLEEELGIGFEALDVTVDRLDTISLVAELVAGKLSRKASEPSST